MATNIYTQYQHPSPKSGARVMGVSGPSTSVTNPRGGADSANDNVKSRAVVTRDKPKTDSTV